MIFIKPYFLTWYTTWFLRKWSHLNSLFFRFYCKSDLPKYPLGQSGEREYILHFYLGDDTAEVRELRTQNFRVAAGSKFIRRQRLQKTHVTNRE